MRARLALVLLVLLFLGATAVRGEDNCGRMDRFATRIPGPPGIPELQLVWIQCDGVFRRMEELVPAASREQEIYDGWVEVGRVYRATFVGRVLDARERMPRHHTGGIVWPDLELLPDDEQRRVVVFRVSEQTIKHTGPGEWVNILRGEILSAEPAPPDPRVVIEH